MVKKQIQPEPTPPQGGPAAAPAALSPLDQPFGESFADYLRRQERHQRALAQRRPAAELEANPRPVPLGGYTSSVATTNHGHQVLLVTKQHGGPWHAPEQILEALRLPAPFGWREFSPISRDQATLKLHTD